MTILLADDHGLYCESIKQWLEGIGEDYYIETVASYDEVTHFLARNDPPKLLMLDLCMPGMNGIETIHNLCKQWPELPILIVSGNEDPLLIKGCIQAGAAGFVPKSGDGESMLSAIRLVLAGSSVVPQGVISSMMPSFSKKQMQILYLLARSRSNQDIADLCYLTPGTVKQYVSDILSKLHVDNRIQAGIRARSILGLSS